MKHSDLKYLAFPDMFDLFDTLFRYSRLATEFGYTKEAEAILRQVEEMINNGIDKFQEVVENPQTAPNEPEDLLQSRRSVRKA